MRRVGVEPRSELVQGFTRNGSAGSSKEPKDGGDSFDNSGGDNGHHGSGSSDHDRRHCGSESHNSDEPIPTSTMLANTVLGMLCSTLGASPWIFMIDQCLVIAFHISSR